MKLPEFMTLIKETWSIYKKNISLFGKLILLSFVTMFGISLVGIIIGIALIFLLSAISTPALVITAVEILVFIAALVAIIYTQSLIQIGFIKAAAMSDIAKIDSTKKWLLENKPMVVGFWAVGFLAGFIVLGGFWLLVIPAIILGLWFSFASYIYVFEGVKGMDALLKSREYVRGVAGKIFVYQFLLSLLTWLIMWLPSYILNYFKLNTFASVYTFIFQILITPISVIFTYLLYKAVKSGRSDVPSSYSRSRKNKYLLIGFITPIVAIIIIAVGVWAYMSLVNSGFMPSGDYNLTVNSNLVQ